MGRFAGVLQTVPLSGHPSFHRTKNEWRKDRKRDPRSRVANLRGAGPGLGRSRRPNCSPGYRRLFRALVAGKCTLRPDLPVLHPHGGPIGGTALVDAVATLSESPRAGAPADRGGAGPAGARGDPTTDAGSQPNP